jgi:hypothetical protein
MSQTEKMPHSGTDRYQGTVFASEESFFLKEISTAATFQHDVAESPKEEMIKLNDFRQTKHDRERESFIRSDPRRQTGNIWT